MVTSQIVTPVPCMHSSARRKPLAACVAAIFAVAAPTTYAVTVGTCTDLASADPTNLRNSIAGAGNSATIDLSGLACPGSTITLALGAIPITQTSLTIKGAGMNALTIDGVSNGNGGMFRHTGSASGVLTIQDITLNRGYAYSASGTAQGGCVYSVGTVILDHARVANCAALTSGGTALGGGVFANKNMILRYSVLDGNRSFASGFTAGIATRGGGAYVAGALLAKYSTISANRSTSIASGSGVGVGGGVYVKATASITESTISGNTAGGAVGGVMIQSTTGTNSIMNSTISGNVAVHDKVGGVLSYAATTKVYNSTIAFNTAFIATGNSPTERYAPGFASRSATTMLYSNLIANNGYGASATQNDVSLKTGSTISGSHNLIRASTSSANLPAGTIQGVCPLLGALRNNGGLTPTHALLSGSRGIDEGSVNTTPVLSYDQRGSAAKNGVQDYARVSGSFADIGAYEVQQADIVFNNGFEGCPVLF